ncbi:two-component system sensor protein [Marinobacter salarius]|uniref:HAMP domain-containing sensor histidine kinase n=1 Tax=Marinobacter salarius TaxID=1420917 RepID=UPI00125A4347|nr:HAMP domain-containing sensor histidine kinase [Marinobacter salarius]VVT32585.1 Histidine kinase [Marinobacter salarius]VXA93431.1 two-component system sensor protein [Marinobacter salarius]
MKSSLTTRLTRTLFALIAATAAASLFIVEQFVDDVENTILDLELKADAEYFKDQLRKGQFSPVKTARLDAIFLPEGDVEAALPHYFQARNPPFSQEIEVGETTLLIVGEAVKEPEGKLFLAQDITIMENREYLVQLVLVFVAAGMLLVGYFVARAGARYLVRPFRKLIREVLGTEPGSAMPRIATDYRDQEFCDIADAFNRFLSELERHIQREKSFVKLASHELRTPLAVMSGALNVLEQRQSLSEADEKTLGRIRRAMQTMRDDTEVLLELARSEASSNGARNIQLREIVQNTIDDLEHGNPAQVGRIRVFDDHPGLRVRAHPVLVRMLLRNLLQNALRHTLSAVEVHILSGGILIKDFGSGLPDKVAENLSPSSVSGEGLAKTDQLNNTTFGLLIVRLVCERLGWELRVLQSDDRGTEFKIEIDSQV